MWEREVWRKKKEEGRGSGTLLLTLKIHDGRRGGEGRAFGDPSRWADKKSADFFSQVEKYRQCARSVPRLVEEPAGRLIHAAEPGPSWRERPRPNQQLAVRAVRA